MKDLIISVVVPVYNESHRILGFIDEVLSVLQNYFENYELIVVDDGSLDGTSETIIEQIGIRENIRLLVLSRHYGTQIAFTAGLDYAIGDYVVIMSSDLCDQPELIPKLVNKIQEDFDVVYISEDFVKRKPWLHRIASSLFYKIVPHLTGLEVHKNASDFMILNRRVVNSIIRLKEQNRYMPMLYAYVGYRAIGIPSAYPRTATSRYNYKKNFGLALDAIINFSDKPLKYVALFSLFTSLVAFVSSLYVVLEKLMLGYAVKGWASLMLVQLLMFSVLFLLLAILSEYISRILIESKNRPLYYVRKEYDGTRLKIENVVTSG